MALIELDLDAPPVHPPSWPPARYFRYVTVFAGVVLTLALGGSAPAAATFWQRAGTVPLTGASASYQLGGGLLYTLDGNANRRTATAWSLDPVRRLWSVSSDLRLDPSGSVIQDDASLSAAGRYTLLQTSAGTTVIDPRTGVVRWASRASLVAHSGNVGIVQQTEFAARTEYDEASGNPGPLYWSDDGVPHTQPPDHTVLRGIDLGTQRELWRVIESGSVFVESVGGDASGFVVIAADRIALLAASTGAVVRDRALPRYAGNDVSYPEFAGDLLVLRHDVSDTGAGTATAFSLDTLEQRWQVTEPAQDGSQGVCLGLPCEQQPDGLAVLDPATGTPRWVAPRGVTIARWGSDALELGGSTRTTALSVRDLQTDTVKVDLRGWQITSGSLGGASIVLFRIQQATGRAGFGLLTPGASGVQLLGLSAERVEQCASDEKHVACRTGSGVEAWSYRT